MTVERHQPDFQPMRASGHEWQPDISDSPLPSPRSHISPSPHQSETLAVDKGTNEYWKLSSKLERVLGLEEGTPAYAQVALKQALNQLSLSKSTRNDQSDHEHDSTEEDEETIKIEKERAWAQAVLHWKAEVARLGGSVE